MVYGVLLLIKMKNSSTSTRSRSSSRSSSRATSPVRTTVSNSAALVSVSSSQTEDRGQLSRGTTAPTSLVCEDSKGAPSSSSQPSKTKEDKRKKSSCSNSSQHTSRRHKKPVCRSRSSSASSSRNGSPSSRPTHKKSSSAAAPPSGATLAAMNRDQRIRRWLQGLKQESLENSIPEEDVPGREDSLEEGEASQMAYEAPHRDETYPLRQSNGNVSSPHKTGDKVI